MNLIVRIVYLIAGTLLFALAVFSGVGKLIRLPRIVDELHGVTKVPLSWFPFLATLEFAGAAGLLVGAFVAPIGVAAASGLTLYFTGAIGAHLRVGDRKGVTSPLVPFVLAVVSLIARVVAR